MRWILLITGLGACAEEPAFPGVELHQTEAEQTDLEETDSPVSITELHNRVRREHGVPDLALDPTLADIAARWLLHLEEQQGCMPMHNRGSPEGENLYWTSGSATPDRVVQAWAREQAHFDYDSNTCADGEVCGHYTQLVWSTTTHVGCASRACADGSGELWMCTYMPAGNVRGQRPW